MSSLVIEIQKDSIDSNTSVIELLRKAYVLAKEIGNNEMLEWINSERKGYSSKADVPKYRIVFGQIKGLIQGGLTPIPYLADAELEKMISSLPINNSIPEIEALIQGQQPGNILHTPLPIGMQKVIWKYINSEIPIVYVFDYAQYAAILSAVRDIILEWSLELEDKEILIEGYSATKEEKEQASIITNNYINKISDSSNIQIQQQSDKSTQEIHKSEISSERISEFITVLQGSIDELGIDEQDRKELKSEISTIRSQLVSSKPKRKIVDISINAIKAILTSASGVAASKLLEMLISL